MNKRQTIIRTTERRNLGPGIETITFGVVHGPTDEFKEMHVDTKRVPWSGTNEDNGKADHLSIAISITKDHGTDKRGRAIVRKSYNSICLNAAQAKCLRDALNKAYPEVQS